MGDGNVTASTEAVCQNDVGDTVTINISCSSGSKFSLQINLDSTVASLKSLLARNYHIPADQQRLIYKGRILKDDQTLLSYGLEADHTVHLVRGFAPTTTNANGSGALNTSQTNTRDVSSDDAGWLGGGGDDLGASLFPGLGLAGFGGNGDFFGAGLPYFDQVQQQWTQNPNMDMPGFRNLMHYTEIFEDLVMNNPQTRDMIDRNPELAHVINDPNTLLRILEASRNPDLMREMTRNTDREMNNIESSPEEFNMLCRMYETVQEPFLNAIAMAGTTGNRGADPFAAFLGTQGGNQARDGSTNQDTSASGTTPTSPAPNTYSLPYPWSSFAAGYAHTNTIRSDSSADARPQAPAGLGGLDLPAFEGLFGTMQDTNSHNQSMQNPDISQLMQSLLSNPQIMNQQLSTLQQSLLSQLSRPQSTQEPAQTGGGAGMVINTGLEALTTMFGGLGAGSLGVPDRSDVPPEQLFTIQLLQLQEMGFIDARENIQALIASAGNVPAAVEWLLGNPGQ